MDYFFMNMESAQNVQAISEESITCVAVKEDRHQNIMSSVALKKGVEEPWTIERVVKFIDLLGYGEITLKSDTQPAIIAFRNRVTALCKAEVTTEHAVKGDKESNGLIENAVKPLRGIIRTIKCHIESRTQEPLSDDWPVIPWLVEHARCILSRCQRGRYGRTPFERKFGKKLILEFVLFGKKKCWQDKSPQIRGTGTAQSVSSGMQMVCSELVKSGDWNLTTDGTQNTLTA